MTEDTNLSQRRLRAWIRLLRLTRASENHLRQYLRVTFNTTLPRFDVMAALYRNRAPMKMSELSRMLLVSNGNATTVVDRLVKDGLALRKTAANDRRVLEVSLTEAGIRSFEQQAKGHEAEVNRLFSRLGPRELDAIRDLLKLVEDDAHDPDI